MVLILDFCKRNVFDLADEFSVQSDVSFQNRVESPIISDYAVKKIAHEEALPAVITISSIQLLLNFPTFWLPCFRLHCSSFFIR